MYGMVEVLKVLKRYQRSAVNLCVKVLMYK